MHLRADAIRPPLKEGSLDAVCCFAALHMFAEPLVALDSFARLLKHGGHIALLTTGRRAWQPMRMVDTLLGQASGQRMFDSGQIAELLRDRGSPLGVSAMLASCSWSRPARSTEPGPAVRTPAPRSRHPICDH
nr:methyltransferase [Kibdelosporangium sp. MJ126-NF4]CTQ95693.1 methyltransferase [Kibdelosporangium sp. MJ126-NF4]